MDPALGTGSPGDEAVLADEGNGKTSEPPLLHVRNLHTHIGSARGVVRAVDDVSFDVAVSEALGVVGESGSGKSVMARSITGLMPTHSAQAGEVYFQGRDQLTLKQKEREGSGASRSRGCSRNRGDPSTLSCASIGS
ncbi:ATP-binding cassette domain-containing protein [Rhodococcus sp. NPDC003318]|uniref:ATP-binding cassette domain-containing protein n=1 Tax=Rhodococcus sp. NPDC003318 TaxID=3364503 RepID=UPI0036C3E234